MTKVVERRCRECGVGAIRPATGKGRLARYKNVELPVPDSLKIHTCDNCGTRWFDKAGAEAFDAAMDAAFQRAVRQRLELLLEHIIEHVPMRRVELALGLSEGYLSKAKQGRSQPSAQLVSSLGLLVPDVEERLEELEKLWQPSFPSTPRRGGGASGKAAS